MSRGLTQSSPPAVRLDPQVHLETGVAGYSVDLTDRVGLLLERCGVLTNLPEFRRVVLKPNWVLHDHPEGLGIDALVTHARILEATCRVIAPRLGQGAAVTIGDAPVQACDFPRLLELNRIPHLVAALQREYPHITFSVEDWRLVRSRPRWSWRPVDRGPIESPHTHQLVDLGTRSFLEPVAQESDRFRVTSYPPSGMQRRHAPGRHQYLIARSALECDLLINLPKLKTHIKAGITGALKNLVGLNGHKEFLPHHRTGSPESGGDSYSHASRRRALFERYYDFHFEHLATLPRPFISLLSRALSAADRLTLRSGGAGNFGSWPGNDTVWRMTLDLNHLIYAWATPRPKQIVSLVDGIVVGEGDGPMRPRAVHGGVLLAGQNPATLDAAGAALLGLEHRAIKSIAQALTSPSSIFATSELTTLPEGQALQVRPARDWEHLSCSAAWRALTVAGPSVAEATNDRLE